jgi:hypothetical protein
VAVEGAVLERPRGFLRQASFKGLAVACTTPSARGFLSVELTPEGGSTTRKARDRPGLTHPAATPSSLWTRRGLSGGGKNRGRHQKRGVTAVFSTLARPTCMAAHQVGKRLFPDGLSRSPCDPS